MKNNKAYIIHHLGLGDHVVCNGLYRNLSKRYKECVLPAKQRNHESLSNMLSDLPNITILPLYDAAADSLMVERSAKYEKEGYELVKLGSFGNNFNVG